VISGEITCWTAKKSGILPHEPRLLRPSISRRAIREARLYIGTGKNGREFAVLEFTGARVHEPIDDPFERRTAELAKIPKTFASFWWTCMRKPARKTGDGWYLDGAR